MSHKRYLPPVLRKLRIHHAGLIVSALAILAVLGLQSIDSLTKPYIDEHFAYTADLQTTEIAYDDPAKQHGSKTYTITNYTLRAISTSGGTALVRTTRAAMPEAANKTETTTRQDTIHVRNGLYVSSGHTQSTETYLFAPRDIDKDVSFLSRYPGYDATATMRYQGTERLHGLSVYRYKAEYTGDIAASAQNTSDKRLHYRPGVTIWIEPTSGWLVKSREETNLYRADSASNDTGPARAGHISRVSTEASVRQHVDYARQLKYQLDLGRQVAPGVLLAGIVLAGAILLAQARRRHNQTIRRLARTSITRQSKGRKQS